MASKDKGTLLIFSSDFHIPQTKKEKKFLEKKIKETNNFLKFMQKLPKEQKIVVLMGGDLLEGFDLSKK